MTHHIGAFPIFPSLGWWEEKGGEESGHTERHHWSMTKLQKHMRVKQREISSFCFRFQRFNCIFFILQGCFWLSSTGQTDLPHIISHPISPLDISLFSCQSSSFQPNFLIALLSTPLSPTTSFQMHLTLSLTSSSKWLTKSYWVRLLLKFTFTCTDVIFIYSSFSTLVSFLHFFSEDSFSHHFLLTSLSWLMIHIIIHRSRCKYITACFFWQTKNNV